MRVWLAGLLLSVVAGRGLADTGARLVRLPPTRGPAVRSAPAVVRTSAEVPVQTPGGVLDNGTGTRGGRVEQPGGTVRLTLYSTLEISLRQNPALVTLRQNEPVSRAALRVAETYPYNPSAQVTVLPDSRLSDGSHGSTVTSIQVMQTLEMAHQPRWRWQVGAAQLTRTQWEIAAAELRSVGEATRRYFTVLYRRQVHTLTARLAELNDELLGILQRRYDAGQATAADVALAGMEARAARQQAELAAAALVAARLNLEQYLGLDADRRCAVVGNLEDWSWRPAVEAMAASAGSEAPGLSWFSGQASQATEARPGQGSGPTSAEPRAEPGAPQTIRTDWIIDVMVGGRPDVRAATADLRAAVAACKLARAAQMPNVDIGPSFEHNEDRTLFWGLGTQMAIPAFGSKRALAGQRSVEVRQKQVALQQRRRQARLEIEAAWKEYERWRRVAERLRGTSADELRRQVRVVEDLFQAGQADLLRVYAARSQAVQVRLGYFQALDALSRAAGNLIEAGGVPPNVLMTSTVRTQP